MTICKARVAFGCYTLRLSAFENELFWYTSVFLVAICMGQMILDVPWTFPMSLHS